MIRIEHATLFSVHGIRIEHYGELDLEMARKKLDQTGAIKQYID